VRPRGGRGARLVATGGGRRLAEALPREGVWGSGLGSRTAHAGEPAAWRGRHLLGAALERVRAVLAAPSVEGAGAAGVNEEGA